MSEELPRAMIEGLTAGFFAGAGWGLLLGFFLGVRWLTAFYEEDKGKDEGDSANGNDQADE